MQTEDRSKKIRVLYDGQCPMCSTIVHSVNTSSQNGAFELNDMHAATDLPVDRATLEKDMYVIDEEGKVFKGAEAILKIIDQYPSWKLVSTIGRLPFVKPLLPIGYGIISRNRRFLFGLASRIFWLKVTVLLGFLVGLILSRNLWLSSRSYPFVPLVPILQRIPLISFPLDWFLFASLLVFGVISLVSSRPQKWIWSLVGVVSFLCVLDQTRWQPWVFQYSFILIVLAFFSWKSEDLVGRLRTLNTARCIVSSTYVFSGLQKLNSYFVAGIFPFLFRPITSVVPSFTVPLFLLGTIAPCIELALGIGLLTRRFRRASVILAILMHLFVLALIGPFGLNINNVVWPWMLAMIACDVLLFVGAEGFSWREVIWPKSPHPFQIVVMVLFGILPILSFFNAWDSYLSSALYSGNITSAEVHLSDEEVMQAPRRIQKYVQRVAHDENVLSFGAWSMGELNVPPYPETRVFKAIGKDLCLHVRDASEMRLVIQERRMFLSAPSTTYVCGDL